jgi:hypothetical protein
MANGITAQAPRPRAQRRQDRRQQRQERRQTRRDDRQLRRDLQRGRVSPERPQRVGLRASATQGGLSRQQAPQAPQLPQVFQAPSPGNPQGLPTRPQLPRQVPQAAPGSPIDLSGIAAPGRATALLQGQSSLSGATQAAPSAAPGAPIDLSQLAQRNPQGFPGDQFTDPGLSERDPISNRLPQTNRKGELTGKGQKQFDLAQSQAAALGPVAAQFPQLAQGVPLTRGDLAKLEFGFNFEQRQNQLARNEAAIRELSLQRGEINTTGPFDDALREQIMGAIRNQSAMGTEDARRQAAQQLAASGFAGGSLGARQLAEIQQRGALGAQGQITDFSQAAAQANEQSRRQAETLRADLSRQISELMSAQFEPFDFSALGVPVRGGRRPV